VGESCKSNEHNFALTDVTPFGPTAVTSERIERTVKIYCTKCGEVRTIAEPKK
jgi:hypothetical protein